MKYNAGIDIGGTFTDLICVSGNGDTLVHKTLSTPEDPSIGFINGIRELAAIANQPFEKFIATHRDRLWPWACNGWGSP